MSTKLVIKAEQIDTYCLSIHQLSICTSVAEPVIIDLVENEVLSPINEALEQWLFQPQDLSRLTRASRLMHEFELSPVALALVFDLLDELQLLRQQKQVLASSLKDG